MALTPEQQAELFKTFAENRARQDAQNRKALLEAGQVQLDLVSSPQDAPMDDDLMQAEYNSFGKALSAGDVVYFQWAIAMDAVDANGYPLPQFGIKNLKPSKFAVIVAGVRKWFEGQAGRKARVQVGDLVVEAQTPEEVETMLKAAMEVLTVHGKSSPEMDI